MVEITGEILQAIDAALRNAFPTREKLDPVVTYRLNENLDNIAGDGKPLSEVVLELIKWAKAHGRIEDLVNAAVSENDTNEQLSEVKRLIAGGVPALVTRRHVDAPGLIQHRTSSALLPELSEWTRKLESCSGCACQIDLQRTQLCGFLIGPGLVMTSTEVISDWPENGQPVRPKALVRFPPPFASDFPGQALGLSFELADRWLACSDRLAGWLVLRLLIPKKSASGLNKWLRMTASTHLAGDPLFVLCYPPGSQPIILLAENSKYNEAGLLTYRADAMLGSLGSPCLNSKLQVVGMHLGANDKHLGDNDKGKVALPISRALQSSAFLEALLEESDTH